MPASFSNCLSMQAPAEPIDVALAARQHKAYVQALRSLLPQVVELHADEAHPDCCFVEDTAVVIGRTALIDRLGAPERRGEESPVTQALKNLGISRIVEMKAPGTLDGGDVLFTGRHIFVGLTGRTNHDGVRQLGEVFGGSFPVNPVPVDGALHLKSLMSSFDPEELLIADDEAGRRLFDTLESRYAISRHYSITRLPDPAAANVLSLGSTVVIQDGFPASEAILTELAHKRNKKILRLKMSELIKADGALTCCSILIS